MTQLKFIGGVQKAMPKLYSTQKSNTTLGHGNYCWLAVGYVLKMITEKLLTMCIECQSYCNRVLFVGIILPPCFFLQDLIMIN